MIHNECPLQRVRIVVVGDPRVGKTSLITTVVSDHFQENVPPKIPSVLVPTKKESENVRTEIIDTSSKPADQHKVDSDIKTADFVCIVYDVNKEDFKKSIESWILRILKVNGDRKVPIGLCGTKIDIRDAKTDLKRTTEELDQETASLREKYDDIEYVLECTTRDKESINNIDELFWRAQNCVIYPRMPLCNSNLMFTDNFVTVLKRMFQLLDNDKDGVLSNDELETLQTTCFSEELDNEIIEGIKQTIIAHDPNGVNEKGVNEHGFLSLIHIILDRGRTNTVWNILWHFGYDYSLKLREEFCSPKITLHEGERVELSTKGVKFLKSIILQHNRSNAPILIKRNLNKLFQLVPSHHHPWRKYGFPQCCQTHKGFIDEDGEGDPDHMEEMDRYSGVGTWTSCSSGGDDEKYEGINLQAWLAMWTMMTFYDYKTTLYNLAYLGFGTVPLVRKEKRMVEENATPVKDAVVVTRMNAKSNANNQRKVFLCHVVGTTDPGKQGILKAFVQHEDHSSRINYAVNQVHTGQYLVLEIPSEPGETISSLAKPNLTKMQEADVIMLVYDQSVPVSFKNVVDMYGDIHKLYPYMPCLLVETMSNQQITQQAKLFCSSNGLPPPVSVKNNQMGELYQITIQTILENRYSRSKNRLFGYTTTKLIVISVLIATCSFIVFQFSPPTLMGIWKNISNSIYKHVIDFKWLFLGWISSLTGKDYGL